MLDVLFLTLIWATLLALLGAVLGFAMDNGDVVVRLLWAAVCFIAVNLVLLLVKIL